MRIAGEKYAYQAISMGAPQIMGFNFGDLVDPTSSSGAQYSSAKKMFDVFAQNELSHINGFFDFVQSKGVLPYARVHNWNEVAHLYNGEDILNKDGTLNVGGAGADMYKELLPNAYNNAKGVINSN